MNNIEKPFKRIFWKIIAKGIEILGMTEINQVTSSKYAIEKNENAEEVYPLLPSQIGTQLNEGEIYSYNQGMVEVRQSHQRTNFEPSETPALFNVYRANTEGAEWVANEKVISGDTRVYNGTNYKCIQSHTTQLDWTPDIVSALWRIVIEQPTNNQWAEGVSYSVGDEVTYNGITYICLQGHTSILVWQPPNVPALWQVN